MGSGVSRAERGRRRESAKEKYDSAMKEQAVLEGKFAVKVLRGNVSLIEECLESRAGFLESTLISAMRMEPKRVEQCLMETIESVFTAVIRKEEKSWESEWEWFQKHLFNSSVWMMRTADGQGFLYQKMIEIAEKKSNPMMVAMKKIIDDLKEMKDWIKLQGIKTKDVVTRQDDEKVALLQDEVILKVLEMKADEVEDEAIEKLKYQVEATTTVTRLCSVGKKIDSEFQKEIQRKMSQYGTYRRGKVKTVERCHAKLENDYQVCFSEI